MEESWLTGNRSQGLLSLTDFAAFSSFGSQAWGTSEPGSRPCLAPYPKQASNKIGMGEDSPEGRGRGSYSPSTQLALLLKTTALPHAGAPPLHLAWAPICCAAGKKGGDLDQGRWPTGGKQTRDPKHISKKYSFPWGVW